MPITGNSIVAGRNLEGPTILGRVIDPTTGRQLEPAFTGLDEAGLDLAVRAAADAFDEYRQLPLERRADFLHRIAHNLDAAAEEIIPRAHRETGLSVQRLEAELARTSGQLRMFASEVRSAVFLGVRIDHGNPDLRLRRIPIGPVAVFGASNFPLAFSTAGGDAAAALAAGCPVVVKAHSAHAGTAELAGLAIADAVADLGLPAGVFSLVFGPGPTVGQALAAHPGIAAVAFTGSQQAGTALMRTASQRPVPIPVFAEMSSINPAIVLPGATGDEALAAGFVASLTLGAGQFCTNPGLLFVPAVAESLVGQIVEELTAQEGQVMLTGGIRAAYEKGLLRLAAGAQRLAVGRPGVGPNAPAPVLYGTDASTIASTPALHDEIFGAAGILVSYTDEDDLAAALRALPGQLTATVHMTDHDAPVARRLLPLLEAIAGRIIFNGWPTGVAVTHAMVHGGPFPATSDSRATSVGTLAIDRFLRPVSYQNAPTGLLPFELHDAPTGIPQRVDGDLRG